MKTFSHVEYKGGHPALTRPCKVDMLIDDRFKEVIIREAGFLGSVSARFKASDIVEMSFDEKAKRSIGKTAAGAIIGGVLTGGIGLLVGGAIGASRKDISNLYLTVNVNGREREIVLKAGKQADDIYAAISGIP
jgi:hypothetical protein